MASQFDSLTGLRGAAATWIALGHTIWALQQVFQLSNPTEYGLRLSWVAVEIFFVLSGFVMAHAYPDGAQTRPAYVSFMVKRFARICPLYLVCLILYMVLVGAHEWGHGPSLMDYVKHLLLLQTWWNYSHHVWLDPAWSLSAEWGSYALFPLCFRFMRLRSRREVLAWLAVLTIGFIVFHLAFAQNNLRMIVQCGVFRAAPCFAIGILLYRLRQLTPNIPACAGDVAAVMFLLTAISLYFVDGDGFLLLPLSALLVFTLSYGTGLASGVMTSKPMMFLGKVSYALYITHYLVYQVTVAMFETIPVWYFPALFAGFIIIAWVSHILIEKPAQKCLTLALTPRAFARKHLAA